MAKLSEREAQICRRLRAFREHTKISRVKFALTIGIGSDRLASYEAGRAPLRYEVFRSIRRHFFISPIWLAEERGPEAIPGKMDESDFLSQVKPRALFTEVYDEHLRAAFDLGNKAAAAEWKARNLETLKMLTESPDILVPYIRRHPEEIAKLKRFARALLNHLRVRKGKQRALRESITALEGVVHSSKIYREAKRLEEEQRGRIGSTPASVSFANEIDVDASVTMGESPSMKAQWPGLLERLKRATKARGMASALARELHVPLASVSRWLGGKREPSGDIALKLLRWVERQEAK